MERVEEVDHLTVAEAYDRVIAGGVRGVGCLSNSDFTFEAVKVDNHVRIKVTQFESDFWMYVVVGHTTRNHAADMDLCRYIHRRVDLGGGFDGSWREGGNG